MTLTLVEGMVATHARKNVGTRSPASTHPRADSRTAQEKQVLYS